jgi:hypothetical protein
VLAVGCGGASTDGFDVSGPAGWTDRGDVVKGRSHEDVQAAWEGPKDAGQAATITVIRAKRPAGVSLAQLMQAGQGTMRRAYRDARVGPVASEPLDGAPAARFDFSHGGAQARQLGAIRGDHLYLVTFTAARAAFARRVATLDALLRSWRWTT